MQKKSGPPEGPWWRIAYSVLNWTIDMIDFTREYLSLTKQRKFEETPSSCDEWSDEEIIHRARRNSVLEESFVPMMEGHTIRFVSDDAVVKILSLEWEDDAPSQALAMQLVRSNTSIPVPCMRRIIPNGRLSYFLLMDHIKGTQLAVAWPRLSIWSKFKIAWTIRGYIRQLRHICNPRSSVPGPLGPGLVAQYCRGHAFGRRSRGPFPNCASLAAFLNKRLAMIIRAYDREGLPFIGPRAPFDSCGPLVFTHHDLNMRNFLLDGDGTVWLVDFGWSGFYPPYFEYHGMCEAASNDNAPRSWQYLIPFMTGPYFEQRGWLTSISSTMISG